MSPSIKLVVVGNGTVGKTSLILTFAVNRFPHGYVPCIYDNHVGEVNIDGKEYSIDLWDTAGLSMSGLILSYYIHQILHIDRTR